MDRVSVSFPVTSFDHDESSWSSVMTLLPGTDRQRRNFGTQEVVRDGVKAFFGVSVIRATGQSIGKVELNPSRIEDPGGWSLAEPTAALRAVKLAWPVLSEFMTPNCEPEQSKLKRADLARDFSGVTKPAQVIRGLAPINRSWARRNLVHADPTKHGAQTLMVGSGAGIARLYDKCAETEGKAPEGSIRWEVESRSEWVQKYGRMKYLADMTNENCAAMAANRWEWSAMGVEVAATSRVVERVMRSSLTERERACFLGWLMMASSGHGWNVGSDHTLVKYRRVQRELGIAIVPGMFDAEDQGERFVSRLDFETGQEVLGVAA